LGLGPSGFRFHELTLLISQVFCLLVFEMAVFMGLIVPLPFTVRRKLFAFVSESPIIAKLQYGLRVSYWSFFRGNPS
jgi:exosortase/archaeosortase